MAPTAVMGALGQTDIFLLSSSYQRVFFHGWMEKGDDPRPQRGPQCLGTWKRMILIVEERWWVRFAGGGAGRGAKNS